MIVLGGPDGARDGPGARPRRRPPGYGQVLQILIYYNVL